jgi:transcriptional regulator with XRE-family HTH domain
MTGDTSPDPNCAALGAALRKLRLAAGMSDTEVADRANLEHAYIPAIEAGEINLRWNMLVTLLDVLGVSVQRLAGELERDDAS